MDADSGRVLYAQDADTKRAIASITKLMTALVALERCGDLDRTVTIQAEYTGIEGSSMYLTAGERVTLRELFYGLLLNSGNDAAAALACITAGNQEDFVQLMNDKAAELGMTNTQFRNPHGLSQEGHYSTARDMAKLAAACLFDEQLLAFTSTKSVTIGGRTMTNHNKLLWQYEGCLGMKTGYTMLAGRTLVSCAERNGQRLIVVTLNDPNDWADHTAMLDYGFSNYPKTALQQAGAEVLTVPVTGSLTRFVAVISANTVAYPLGAEETVTTKFEVPEKVEAPLAMGQTVGTITYYLNGAEVGQARLVCAQAVTEERIKGTAGKGFWKNFFQQGYDTETIYRLPASG